MRHLIVDTLTKIMNVTFEESSWKVSSHNINVCFKDRFTRETYILFAVERSQDQTKSWEISIKPLSERVSSHRRAFEIGQQLCHELPNAEQRLPKYRLKHLYHQTEFLNTTKLSVETREHYSFFNLLNRDDFWQLLLYAMVFLIPLSSFIGFQIQLKREQESITGWQHLLILLISILSPIPFLFMFYLSCVELYWAWWDYRLLKRTPWRTGSFTVKNVY